MQNRENHDEKHDEKPIFVRGVCFVLSGVVSIIQWFARSRSTRQAIGRSGRFRLAARCGDVLFILQGSQ
jgi:hypothetical protein